MSEIMAPESSGQAGFLAEYPFANLEFKVASLNDSTERAQKLVRSIANSLSSLQVWQLVFPVAASEHHSLKISVYS